MQGVVLLLLGWLMGALPAQSRAAGHMLLERHDDACSELSPNECCAQMLEIAVFRATGDQVPRAAKTPVKLSCEDPDRTIPQNACRLLAMGRGFGARETQEICAPAGLVKRCSDDDSCKQCMTDLDRLAWKLPQRACYALTYLPKAAPTGTTVVNLSRANGAAANGGVRTRTLITR
jgi:hypothetical protein